MTTNQLLVDTMVRHMNVAADSGMSRLTRTGLLYQLLEVGCPETRAHEWIALCDRQREQMFYAQQRAHRALLQSCTYTEVRS